LQHLETAEATTALSPVRKKSREPVSRHVIECKLQSRRLDGAARNGPPPVLQQRRVLCAPCTPNREVSAYVQYIFCQAAPHPHRVQLHERQEVGPRVGPKCLLHYRLEERHGIARALPVCCSVACPMVRYKR
jgi:hypothetical protein